MDDDTEKERTCCSTCAETLSIVTELRDTLNRFRPLLEKYERASAANNVFAAHRAMKGAR